MQMRASIARALVTTPDASADGRAFRRARRVHAPAARRRACRAVAARAPDGRVRHPQHLRGGVPVDARRGDGPATRPRRSRTSPSTSRFPRTPTISRVSTAFARHCAAAVGADRRARRDGLMRMDASRRPRSRAVALRRARARGRRAARARGRRSSSPTTCRPTSSRRRTVVLQTLVADRVLLAASLWRHAGHRADGARHRDRRR